MAASRAKVFGSQDTATTVLTLRAGQLPGLRLGAGARRIEDHGVVGAELDRRQRFAEQVAGHGGDRLQALRVAARPSAARRSPACRCRRRRPVRVSASRSANGPTPQNRSATALALPTPSSDQRGQRLLRLPPWPAGSCRRAVRRSPCPHGSAAAAPASTSRRRRSAGPACEPLARAAISRRGLRSLFGADADIEAGQRSR